MRFIHNDVEEVRVLRIHFYHTNLAVKSKYRHLAAFGKAEVACACRLALAAVPDLLDLLAPRDAGDEVPTGSST